MKRWIAVAAVWGLLGSWALPSAATEVVYEASPSDLAPSYWAPYDEDDLRIAESPQDEIATPGRYQQGLRAPESRPFQYVPPLCCADETPLQRFRQSAYQGTTLSGGVIGDSGSDALTISHYELSARFALPIDGMDNVLLIAPHFREDVVDAPAGVDIPDSLYQTGVSFTWLKTLSPRWKATTIVSPSVRSDFQTSDDAVRVFGLGMLTYRYIPETLDLSFGAVYLDRDDIPLLPVLGFNWTPTPQWQIDINFPRPRIARRVAKRGGVSESWIYTAVGLGGNTWAVERADGSHDVLTLRDYQWMFGWEGLRSGGRGWFIEGGAAFGRALEYQETDEEVDFDDALFVRMGITL